MSQRISICRRGRLGSGSDGPQPFTGFELFGLILRINMAGYSSVGIAATKGVFPKIETTGWTGIAFINVSGDAANITLSAFDDQGNAISSSTKNLPPGAKQVDLVEDLFESDIGLATTIQFTSSTQIVGFQLNGSQDMRLLDALPVLKIE